MCVSPLNNHIISSLPGHIGNTQLQCPLLPRFIWTLQTTSGSRTCTDRCPKSSTDKLQTKKLMCLPPTIAWRQRKIQIKRHDDSLSWAYYSIKCCTVYDIENKAVSSRLLLSLLCYEMTLVAISVWSHKRLHIMRFSSLGTVISGLIHWVESPSKYLSMYTLSSFNSLSKIAY